MKAYGLLRMAHPRVDADAKQKQTLIDMLIDSAIVGGISGVSAFVAGGSTASPGAAILAFALTFLIKLRALRGIKP